ncbi:MAG: tryptophan halogenase family protein, partial [Povalibacter sp.]
MQTSLSTPSDSRVRQIVVVGAGIAAWLSALTLSKIVKGYGAVTVVDVTSAPSTLLLECATSSLPPLRALHRSLGIDERAFMRATGATFKLGAEFIGWTQPGSSYFHPLGEIGAVLQGISFHHHWLRAGGSTDFTDFSLNAAAARLGRFVHPASDPRSILSTLDYAYHLDAQLYVAYLRTLAIASGISPVTSSHIRIERRQDNGFIEAVTLDSGARVSADLFIDCSGPSALLIEQSLGTAYEDWTHFLPCNRIVAGTTPAMREPPPFTQITREGAGWSWHIPLQHQSSVGYVYPSDEPNAGNELSAHIDMQSSLPFISGHRKQFWNGNCVAIGSAAGFLDPLHSTNLHLIHTALSRLAALFPRRDDMQWVSAEFNRQTTLEYERIRDILIFHYQCAAGDNAFSRPDEEIPETLRHKLRVFGNQGRVVLYDEELFDESHWVGVLFGQNIRP